MMTWVSGDYWEFLAWAILSDPTASDILAMAAGYSPDSLPLPGTRVGLPLSAGMEAPLERRLASARLVRDASAMRRLGDPSVMALLEAAVTADPEWSVPRTDMAILFLESGDRRSAADILSPVVHKYTPALMMAMLDWEEGLTESAMVRISEAMAEPDPPPETLAAAGVMYTVTGDAYLASQAWRKILEDPDAPSHIRLMAMEMLLRE
jgi:Flp pilus assembly protein TadD